MSLFKQGTFQLHAGGHSDWKIDCDALTDEDLMTLAKLAITYLPSFGLALGVPTGGTRFARILSSFATNGPILIVDDVLTTGQSMEEARAKIVQYPSTAIGLVIFARGALPDWVKAIFVLRIK